MAIVNSAVKYTLDELPGDDWEVRRTKQIVRAIVAAKNELGMTTEVLAERCSTWLGKAGAVKPATLNGLFSGKRKSLSVSEIEMFASVLLLPLLDLVYPPKQLVEVRPDESKPSVDALVGALRPMLFFPGVLGQFGVPVGSRAEEMLRFIRDSFNVEASAVIAIAEVRLLGWDDPSAQLRLERLKVSVGNLAFQAHKLQERFGEVPQLQPTSAWAIEMPDRPSDWEIDEALLDRIEPLFKGHQSGGYRLGEA